MKKLLLIPFLFLFLNVKSQTVTWADNIACIMYSHCTSCHNPDGIAPFSLMTYNEVVNSSFSVVSAVNNGRMPPWPPDKNYQTYAHERVLSDQQKQLINDWVNGGFAQGNLSNAPVPPVYNGTAEIANPDLSVIMPVYTIPAGSSDLYRCFVLPTNTTVDQFITGLEVIPGNRSIVHHVLVFQDTSNTPDILDANDPGPGYTSFGDVGSSTARQIGAWVPGSRPNYMPAGMGIKLDAGAKIVIQVHYPAGSSLMEDSTRINLLLTSNPATRNVFIAPVLNHSSSLINGPLFIPADSIRTFYGMQQSPLAVTILSVGPHMHLIGTEITSYAVTPAQDTIPFIHIPKWNFHWQGDYHFRQPLKIPVLSTLHSIAKYDNTVNNPFQPVFPPQDVSLGESTTDEMMLIYFAFLPYQAGDENIVVDTSSIPATYNNCNFITSVEENKNNTYTLPLYPNPASVAFIADLPSGYKGSVEMFDYTGKLVWRKDDINGDYSFDVSGLTEGIYLIRCVGNKTVKPAQIVVRH